MIASFSALGVDLPSIALMAYLVDTKVDSVDTKADPVDTKADSVDTKADSVDIVVDSVDIMADSVDTKAHYCKAVEVRKKCNNIIYAATYKTTVFCFYIGVIIQSVVIMY